jgi:hypothetical protein
VTEAQERTHTSPESPAQRFAWVAPVGAVTVAFMFGPSLESGGLSTTRLAALSLLLGVVGGMLWQRLCRRDFVSRFAGWTPLPLIAALLALVAPGAVSDFYDRGWAAGGVVVGVVIAELWLRRRSE